MKCWIGVLWLWTESLSYWNAIFNFTFWTTNFKKVKCLLSFSKLKLKFRKTKYKPWVFRNCFSLYVPIGRHSVSHVEIFFCFFIPKKTWLYEELSHFLFILNGMEKFIFCKLFVINIHNGKRCSDMNAKLGYYFYWIVYVQ